MRTRTVRVVLLVLAAVPVLMLAVTNPVFGGGGSAFTTNETVSDDVPGPTAFTGTELVVLDERGQVTYHETRRDEYWDIDPVGGTSDAVVVSTVEHDTEELGCSNCVIQRIERINITTDERSVLYREVTPGKRDVEWHDVDRINETHYVIADISQHEVEIVDITTATTVWEWSAYTALSPSSGGAFDGDWTHLNDVEVVRDGQYVTASLRNHDTVVFINRTTGEINRTLSLGRDEAHSILFEQHNPDYIPRERGGPAMLVADSNNDRVVEYQFENGEWVESWVWRDARLKWPRDADRLPNGHTLVTDTNGDRVVEIDERGDVVWSVTAPIDVYEAERLSTPDESGNGTAAATANLSSRAVQPDTPLERVQAAVVAALGPYVVNGAILVTPGWMGAYDFVGALVSAIALVSLVGYEASVQARVRVR